MTKAVNQGANAAKKVADNTGATAVAAGSVAAAKDAVKGVDETYHVSDIAKATYKYSGAK